MVLHSQSHKCPTEGKDLSLTCWLHSYPCSRGMQATFFAITAHSRVMLKLLFTRPLRPLPAALLPGQLVLHPSFYTGLFHSMGKTLHQLFLTFGRFLSGRFFSLPRCPWIAALPSSTCTAACNLMSSTALLRLHSIPSLMPLMKILNSVGPQYWTQRDLTSY